jgi:hypothetical protein
METHPGMRNTAVMREGRGSGAGVRKRRRDALGPRKDVIIRLPEAVVHQLKLVAAYERMTIQDFCEQAIVPQIRQALKKHGVAPDQLT